jgi:hypothetical protein
VTARRSARPSVKVGAQVRFRGVKWQVVALSGQVIHLVCPDGGGQVVLAGHLFADPGFTIIGAEVPQAAPQWGLFETAPAAAREKALAWQRHVQEVECGLADGPGSAGAVRERYDPARHTLAEREQAKAEELTALGFGRISRTTVQRMRLAYRKQGLWGLLDHRTTRTSSPTGRSDERVVAAVREALRRRRGRSKGTINGLFPPVKSLPATVSQGNPPGRRCSRPHTCRRTCLRACAIFLGTVSSMASSSRRAVESEAGSPNTPT